MENYQHSRNITQGNVVIKRRWIFINKCGKSFVSVYGLTDEKA